MQTDAVIAALDEKSLVQIKGLEIHFPVYKGIMRRQRGAVKAVDGVNFEIYRGETLGLVGESGCGKTTVGRAILRLYRPTNGHVNFDGHNIAGYSSSEMRNIRPRMQMIFQDPQSSLNPRMTVGSIVGEPLDEHSIGSKKEKKQRVEELLDAVGLNSEYVNRYPHEFSGGQRQRIGIARALALKPEFIVCDEPIAALDVSIQAQVVNLLEDLQDKLGLTYLFISHDLAMVRYIADRVAVMYLGKIVELASVTTLFNTPQHPYTRALLSAVPIPDPAIEAKREHIVLKGDVPNPANPPKGCVFGTRCAIAETKCFDIEPKLRDLGSNQYVACHLAGQ